MIRQNRFRSACATAALLFVCSRAAAQDADQHQHSIGAADDSWMLMQDGVVFAEFNHQGGPRGGNEFLVPNWWMGMASRNTSKGRVTLNAMFSLDPATVGAAGYRELFQAGEAFNGEPLIDRQHPHDFFMQLAAIWRVPITDATGFTLAGGPAGEPALGPVAFMHRASAADNPTAPLTHHTFDSTHIAFGVVTAALDHGPWVLEASLFNGREPDQHRWNVEFGRLDSFSGRVWFKPNEEWELQASSGRLKEPEELEPGDTIRSTLSASWTRQTGTGTMSMTAAFGRNDTDHGSRNAMFVEGARMGDRLTIYTRFEALQLEEPLFERERRALADGHQSDPAAAFTIGGVRNIASWRGFDGGVGADFTFYGVPDALQPFYSAHPVSFHVFFRVRPPTGSTGRMWNMRMSQPIAGHGMTMPMTHPMP